MIRKLFLRSFLTITALSLSALIMLYLVFINTDKFIDYFEDNIKSLLLTTEYGYKINYLEISGNLSNGLLIKGLELKDINSTLTFNKIKVVPVFSSSFYFFLQSIFNSKDIANSVFKYKTLSMENVKISNGETLIEIDNILVYKNKIKSPTIKILLPNHTVIAEDLLITTPFNMNLDKMKLNNIINKENTTTISSVSYKINTHENIYRYDDIDIKPTLFRIKEGLKNLTIHKCYYNYNQLKYYFTSDLNINTYNDNFNLTINTFKVYNEKNKKRIDLYGDIDFNDMSIDITATTEKLNYFNLMKPEKGYVDVKGQNYVYNVDFKLKKVKKFVENIVDEISGEFTLNFSDSLDYIIHFNEPIRMRDKDYDGTFTISDIKNFNDIYNPSIIIGTNRINPFKLNQFKQLD